MWHGVLLYLYVYIHTDIHLYFYMEYIHIKVLHLASVSLKSNVFYGWFKINVSCHSWRSAPRADKCFRKFPCGQGGWEALLPWCYLRTRAGIVSAQLGQRLRALQSCTPALVEALIQRGDHWQPGTSTEHHDGCSRARRKKCFTSYNSLWLIRHKCLF